MRYAELDIPEALSAYAPPLSTLSAFFLPGQDQVNWCRKEITIAAAKDPPFQPYLLPKLTETPWMPSDSDHDNARKRWAHYAKQAKRSLEPQELTIQAFTLYHMRFLFAADLCRAFSKFGGLGPQLAHLSTVLHLGITESVGTALAYHRLIGKKLQEIARKRTASATDFTALLANESFTFKERAKKEIASAINTDVRDKEQKRKASGKGEKGDTASGYRGKTTQRPQTITTPVTSTTEKNLKKNGLIVHAPDTNNVTNNSRRETVKTTMAQGAVNKIETGTNILDSG